MARYRNIFFALWVCTILCLSLMPVPDVNTPDHFDKGVHFLMYFFTTLVFFYAFKEKFPAVILYAFFFSSFYGAFIEVLQGVVPYRSFSVADIIANCLGALAAGVVLFLFQRQALKRGK